MEEVLSWSKREVEGKKESAESCKIHEVVDNVIKHLSPQSNKKNITVTNQVQQGIHACADYDTLSIIIRNLIANAIKFTSLNGHIDVTSEVGTEMVRIGVIDNGIGIPEKIRKSLFLDGKAGTRRGTNDEKGTGVGLIIVNDLVRQSKGHIWVSNGPGDVGTAFYFTVPLDMRLKPLMDVFSQDV
jgi:signal transduction histidine kinase